MLLQASADSGKKVYLVLGRYLPDDVLEAAGQCTLLRTPLDLKDIGGFLKEHDYYVLEGSEAAPDVLHQRFGGVDIAGFYPKVVSFSEATLESGDALLLIAPLGTHEAVQDDPRETTRLVLYILK